MAHAAAADFAQFLKYKVNSIRQARSSAEVAEGAGVLGSCLSGDAHARQEIAKELIDQHITQVVSGLIHMLYQEEEIIFLDEYTYLLTGLRYATRQKRLVNMLILENTKKLLKPFELGFKEAPNGYTAPELVSMWSSILNEEGLGKCNVYMECLVPVVSPCIASKTIGSVVAALLISNLVGHRDEHSELFGDATQLMIFALKAAFDGSLYAERQWGPGPVMKSFSSLSCSDVNKRRLFEQGELVALFVDVVRTTVPQWRQKVDGFDDAYYMGAKASACKALGNIAQRHDVEEQCPETLRTLQIFLEQKDLSEIARYNAMNAAFQMCCNRRNKHSETPKDGPLIAVIVHDPSGKMKLSKPPQHLAGLKTFRCSKAGPSTQLQADDANGFILMNIGGADRDSVHCPLCTEMQAYAPATQRPLLDTRGLKQSEIHSMSMESVLLQGFEPLHERKLVIEFLKSL